MSRTFDLIDSYDRLGLVTIQKDGSEIRNYFIYYLKFVFTFLILFGLPTKCGFCLLFDQNDEIQWFIGDFLNNIDSYGRYGIHICGFAVGYSIFFQQLYFRWLNRNKKKELINWMKIFSIIKSTDHKYIGLPRKETQLFLSDQNELNYKLDRIFKISSYLSGFFLNIYLTLLTKFKISLFNYILFGTIHFMHFFFYVYLVLYEFIDLNLYTITICKFYKKKFEYLNFKIAKLNDNDKHKYNRKLNKLIRQFNYVIMELMKTNQYFKYYFGSYFFTLVINFLVLGFVVFVPTNLIIKIVVIESLMGLLFMICILPYYESNKILIKIKDLGTKLQKKSFNSKTCLKNKIKINYISFYLRDQKIGFSCFDLFMLNVYNSFLISINLISYILMILRITNVLN